MTAPDSATIDIAARIGAALLCGAVVGLNRDLHRKPAGLRTFGLMALGTATLTVALGNSADPSAMARVVQGLITGIGFLGAGMIMRGANSNEVHGLTTAAAVWLTAALSILCGLGQIPLAFAVLGTALVLLVIGLPIERRFELWFGREAGGEVAIDDVESARRERNS